MGAIGLWVLGSALPIILGASEAQSGTQDERESVPDVQSPPAAPDLSELAEMPLEELLKIEVTIASTNPRSVRDQPGIVTVVTAEEVRASGARDLLEILQQVPGFSFGQDIMGVIGPAFRGPWAYEGKAQLVLDGIERIEIIRGPGSVLYGGTAELAVIRVETRGMERDASSVGLESSSDGTSSGFGASALTSGTSGELHVSASTAYASDGRLSRRYTDLAGSTTDMSASSTIRPVLADLGLRWGRFSARLLYDDYRLESHAPFGPVEPTASSVRFASFGVQAAYDATPLPWLSITTKLAYRYQQPWEVHGALDAGPGPAVDAAQLIEAQRLTLDALGSRRVYVQPFAGGAAPLPGKGREVFVRLTVGS